MFILIVGGGRVGSSLARAMLRDGHAVSCLDEDPEAHARLEIGLESSWEDSGGQFVFLSPGASYRIMDSVWLYAYYQQPVYQHVNGVQLTASHAFVMGVTTRF